MNYTDYIESLLPSEKLKSRIIESAHQKKRVSLRPLLYAACFAAVLLLVVYIKPQSPVVLQQNTSYKNTSESASLNKAEYLDLAGQGDETKSIPQTLIIGGKKYIEYRGEAKVEKNEVGALICITDKSCFQDGEEAEENAFLNAKVFELDEKRLIVNADGKWYIFVEK